MCSNTNIKKIRVYIALILLFILTTTCYGINPNDTIISEVPSYPRQIESIFKTLPEVKYTPSHLHINNSYQNNSRTRSRFWDLFGLGIEAAYHANVYNPGNNIFRKEYYDNDSPFDNFYWDNGLWFKLELNTPIINISYQFDFPFYSSTRENIHKMSTNLNFYGISEKIDMKNGMGILLELLLPDVSYKYIGSRAFVMQDLDVSAASLLRYKLTSRTYYSEIGRNVEDVHRIYYLSISRYIETMSKYSRYLHKYCSAHGFLYSPFMKFPSIPLPYMDLSGSFVVSKSYDREGNLLNKNSGFSPICMEFGLLYVADFFIDNANLLIQPRIYWSMFNFFGSAPTGLNLSLGIQYFM